MVGYVYGLHGELIYVCKYEFATPLLEAGCLVMSMNSCVRVFECVSMVFQGALLELLLSMNS